MCVCVVIFLLSIVLIAAFDCEINYILKVVLSASLVLQYLHLNECRRRRRLIGVIIALSNADKNSKIVVFIGTIKRVWLSDRSASVTHQCVRSR